MGRSTNSTSFSTPVISTGTVQEPGTATFGRGTFTLLTGVTYFFPLGGQDASALSAHLRWDASIVLTSVTVEDCNFSEDDVALYDDAAGDWIDEDPSTAFVGSDGAGVTVTASSGGSVG